MKLELRALTNSPRKRDRAVMISSTMPSAKYSCSGSPLMLLKGKTAIDGLWETVRAAAFAAPFEQHSIDPDRPRDILELLLTCVLEGEVELALCVLLHATRHADATRLSKALQTCRDVHTITENVTAVDYDVANIDANAKLDPFFLRHTGVALGHSALNLNGTTHRIHHAAELSSMPS